MFRISVFASVLMAGVSLASLAYAQTGAPADATETELDEVMVTGSRIVRDGYEAPTPTTVVGAEEIQARSPANIADYVNQLPQFGNATSPRTTLQSSSTIGGGANLLNMRGLGTARTLVLLDGRRVVSAGLNSAVDINLLPTNLVKRVDVVTGGASAAYGSDAVAGVTNFILDPEFTGWKGSISAGVTDRKDGENWNGDLAYGRAFAGGRGHILLSVQGLQQYGIDDIRSRDWYRPGYNFIANPAYTTTNGQPARILRTDVGFTNATLGGLITSGPQRGLVFLEGNARGRFVWGDILAGTSQAGGTLEDPAYIWGLLPDLKNWSTFGRTTYEFTDSIRGYAEFGGGGSDSDNWSAPTTRFANITIRNDNVFLPADLRTSAFAPGATTFTMGRLNYDLHEPGDHHQTEIGYHRRQKRYLVGAEGDFLETGKWNAYYQRGDSDVWYTYSNMLIPAYYDLAVDAIANPAVGGVAGVAAGAPICRSTLTNPTNGCVPVNIFGINAPSQESIAYLTGVTKGFAPARQDIDIKQEVWAIDGQIEPFSTWAGPVSVAAGFEYRKEGYTAVVDEASKQRLWFGGGFTPSAGDFTVKEFFGETIVPLLADVPFIQRLEFNGAARRTDYSTSGKVTTWKAGLAWEVYDDLRFRGTLSRDIRAPNLLELFNGGVATVGQTRDPTQAGSPNVSTRQITGGNPNLTPEIAKTRTFGAVFRPSFVPGLSASVDYYKISVKDAITTVSTQQIVDQCFGVGVPVNAAACASIVRANPNNLIDATIYTGGINAQKQVVEGVDYELSYRAPIETLGVPLPGQIDLRALGSQRLTSETILAGALTDILGTPADGPEWRWLFSASYLQGPSRTTATVRYFGSGVINNWPMGHPQSVNVNRFGEVAYLELAQNYDVYIDDRKVTFFGVVENVFDRDPPRVPGQTYGASSLHDLLGRSYRVGARFAF
ncbi:TonB-dependent siderophore receptor [Phenylobacterium sp. J367]|uniref:TonB-dependent receptor plug domain-containing protein n=1 Tax=Phenylobacterium sp. J367 TaxID=2898435 RepID=UPI00215158F0|nr:TonB-dependent receptor [Phenylobacterium sp. J367]MCR5877394.1 TonB-dependent receptor [Phenylobacterium sp. J367]